LTYTIEYIGISWVVAPFFQTHDWIANSDGDGGDSHEKRKCCRRCRDGKCVKKPPLDPQNPVEVSTRYIPFSLYNDVFMMLNEGYMLNREINESLDYFPANIQIFIQSIIFRGLLNFFLFLNALLQVQFVLQNEHSYVGFLLTINSLLVCTLNLQAYLWAMVFCVVGTPYWLYITLMKCGGCIDREDGTNDNENRKPDGTKKIKKGSFMYACLLFVWKRVNF
jgi:hypothetical protein